MSIRDKYINLVEKLGINSNIYRNNLCNIPIYFINLERSKSRKQFILGQIEEYNIKNTHFIKAIDGNDILKLEDNYYSASDNLFFHSNSKNTSMSEYGCTLSHIKSIMKAYKDGHEHVLICEDDVDLYWIKIWNTTIDDIIKNAPENWEYISLSKRCNKNFKDNEYASYKKYSCYLTTGQIINRKGMKKIIDTIYKDKIYMLDYKNCKCKKMSSDYVIPSILNSYVYKNRLIMSYNNYSDMNSTIHTNHTNGHIRFNNFSIKTLYKNYIK